MHRLAILLLLAITAACATTPADTKDTAHIYVLRHAEKLDGKDPDLTATGRQRAEEIAAMLRDAGIRAVFSTDTRRTRQTGSPLARALGLELQIYDHREQQVLAELLKARGETVLVVGHSNTIAEFVAALGGEPGPKVGDDEYDRLYVVTVNAGGVRSELRRYGPR